MTKKLTKRDITKYRKTIGNAWSVSDTNDSLDRTFSFASFVEAFMFVTRVGVHAEVMQLYPHIEIDAAVVHLHIGDKRTPGLRIQHFELAEKIDIVYALSTKAAQRHRTQ